MTRAEFARYMGVHKSQVTRWVQAGMPTREDGGVDAEVARTWVKKNIDPTRRAMVRRRPAAPPGCEHLTANPVDAALVAALPGLAQKIPALAAVMAMASGASREIAESVHKFMVVAVMQEVGAILDKLDIPPPPAVDSWSEASIWDLKDFAEVNWEGVGAMVKAGAT